MNEEGRTVGQKDSVIEEEAREMRYEKDPIAISDFEDKEYRWV